MSDGSTVTSTGTITIQVSDYAKRKIDVLLPSLATDSRIPGITLTGTDLLGNSVEMPIEYSGGAAFFSDLLPGDYSIQIPAIPFLQNASEAKVIPFSSAADAGDGVVDSGLGRLRPEFISIRDWLGSTPRRSILTVVAPGDTSTLIAKSSSESSASTDVVTVSLDGSASLLKVNGIRPESTSTDGTTTPEAMVEATVSRGTMFAPSCEVRPMVCSCIASDPVN